MAARLVIGDCLANTSVKKAVRIHASYLMENVTAAIMDFGENIAIKRVL